MNSCLLDLSTDYASWASVGSMYDLAYYWRRH